MYCDRTVTMDKKDKRLANLKPFKKGDDPRRNLKGQPKKLPNLDTLLADLLGDEDDDKSEAMAVLRSLLVQAKKGNVRAIEVMLERAYGKPKQTVDQNINIGDFKISDVIKFTDKDG